LSGNLENADPHSLLFMSVDLVGSTSYKQQKGSDWPRKFLQFYREFPQALAEVQSDDSSVRFSMWKPIGDELIFTCRVDHEADVVDAVRTWLAAMRQYEERSLSDVPLKTKGGAFIATFPGPDTQATAPLDPFTETSSRDVLDLNDDALRVRDRDRFIYDYIGPSIDTGFRILSACDQRFFTMSIEVAWAFSWGVRGLQQKSPDIAYLGERDFKGVWGGRRYPVVAIDRQFEDAVNEAIRGMSSTATVDVEALCKACLESDGWPSRMYLPKSDFAPFKVLPEDALREHRVRDVDGIENVATELVPAPQNAEVSQLPMGDEDTASAPGA
jgi:hypothetical protein